MAMYGLRSKYCVASSSKNKKTKQKMWGRIQLGSFRAEFPQPRIPRLLGAARSLPASMSVYPRVRLDVPIILQKLVLAAGAVSIAVPLDLTTVRNFASRFATLFREYAIVGAALEVRCNEILNPAGVAHVYLDEETATISAFAESEDRPRLDVLLTNQTVPGSYKLNWKPADILDLDFVSTATTFTPVWLKCQAGPSSGTGSSTTGEVLVTGALAFEFRGYA